MNAAGNAAYRRWLEENATIAAVTYSGLIVVLLPAFHWVLLTLPGVSHDSLALRLAASALAAVVGLSLLFFPRLRRYANALQYVNLIAVLAVISILVVDSGNNHWYVATQLLAVIGAQQAFYRARDLAIVTTIAFAFQVAYSAYAGQFGSSDNTAALATYGCGFVIAFVTGALRIQIQHRELASRLKAQQIKAELEKRELELRVNQARIAEVHAITHFGNFERDLTTDAVEWSEELLKIFGLPSETPKASLPGHYESSIHPKDADAVGSEIEKSRRSGAPFSVDHRVILRDGSTRWFHLRGKHEYAADGRAVRFVAAVLDVTARKQAEDDLLRLARIDTLTSLPNRGTLQTTLRDTLRDAQAHGRRCAVLFLDMDRFKDTNDTLGHALGDTLLRSVAIRFSAVLPPGSTLARWGGDEFVVILPTIRDDDESAEVARALIRTIAEPFFIDEFELLLSVSVGIAIYPLHGSDATILIRNADTAMYHAKEREGLHYAFFEAAMHEAVTARHRIQNELRKAAANDDLVLHYQPIVETSTARIIGAEALLRWRQSDGSLLYPSGFIPIAEETGLIVPIGSWVLQQACKQIAAWQARGSKLILSVNVSARQFAHPDFIEVLRRCVRDYAIDPSFLDVEITETVLMSGVDSVLAVMSKMSDLGVHLTIDDFGTGYSALAYLKRFPLNSIKLDRTFVTEIDSTGDRSILRAIVTIAHTLGLSVTAEGVETAAQLQTIEDTRCDQAQGFYIAKPMPLHEFDALCVRVGEGAAVEPPRRALALVSETSERIPLRRVVS